MEKRPRRNIHPVQPQSIQTVQAGFGITAEDRHDGQGNLPPPPQDGPVPEARTVPFFIDWIHITLISYG